MSNQSSKNHWEKYHNFWNYVGAPLRPSSEDLYFLKKELLPKVALMPSEIKQVTLLGVTPELATLPWPQKTKILAVDKSSEMIHRIWPQDKVTYGKAIVGNWLELPLRDNSSDIILGDGCFVLMNYRDEYPKLLSEVFRVIKEEGLFAMRFFLRPPQSENIDIIFEELKSKNIGNFNVFKWRLAMAMQNSVEAGILMSDVWKIWKQKISKPEKIMRELDWPIEVLSTIEIYQNSPNVYTFPTLNEIRKLFSSQFIELSIYIPDYELGERCPTIIFKPRK